MDGYDITLLRNIIHGLVKDVNIRCLENCETLLQATLCNAISADEPKLKSTKASWLKVAGTGV
ncbi:hypothetical protein [Spiroplasma endosymbiont of Panorpa germanica]|uniref:hypothetical protein n=1 Tax=Spiroplasma endosymbiont of Panorpa germanica TaxID=3066314 RepID=UPI0030D46217